MQSIPYDKHFAIADRESLVAKSAMRGDCINIIEAGLAAANPAGFIPRYVRPDQIITPEGTIKTEKYRAIYTVAFGKASDSMTGALNSILQERLAGGIIVMPKGPRALIKSKKFQVFNSRHPTPDQTSVRAARAIIKFLHARRQDELVVFLVSGGGSSLVALPDGITLGEKTHMANLLLKSGATIQEINKVRRCISKIKGGKMAGHLRCDGIGLVMSDVQGDDIASIASGPTVAENNDKNSNDYSDALRILDSYGLHKKAGAAIRDVLHSRDRRYKEHAKAPPHTTIIENSTKTQDISTATTHVHDTCSCGQKGAHTHSSKDSRMIGNYIIAKNSDCFDAMAAAATSIGYSIAAKSPLLVFGDIKAAAQSIHDAIPQGDHECLIFGGEPTTRVLGNGTGGRNQELVLRLLKKAQGTMQSKKKRKIVMASVGTDGIDGNSIYAGAIAENTSIPIDAIKDAIKKSDSSGFFERRRRSEGGGVIPPSCIRTGHTHTNLMDIGLVLT